MRCSPLVRGLVLVMMVSSAAALYGCRDKTRAPQKHVKPAPPPPPPDLLAEVYLAQPRRVIGEVRDAAGGSALMLPRSIGGLVANVMGYPIRSAEMFDEQLPIVAAVSQPKPAITHWAVAVHMRHRDALLLLLSGGARPPFNTQPAGEAQCLVRNDPDNKPSQLLGCVLDHYLVITPSLAAAKALAPYTVRALAAQQPSAQGDILATIKRGAFEGWLPTQLSTLRSQYNPPQWLQRVSGFVDIDSLLTRAEGWSRQVGGARTTITLGRKAWTLHGTLSPHDDAAAARWNKRLAAPTQHLGALPDDTMAAASWFEDSSDRAAQAQRQGALFARGGAFDEDDRELLTQALGALSEGRGERTLLGVRCTGVGITGFARSNLHDSAKLDSAVKRLVAFSRRKAVLKQLDQQQLVLTHKTTRMLNLPYDVGVFRLQPKRPQGRPATPADALGAIDLRYTISDKYLLAAAGYESLETLKLMYAPDEERQLLHKPTVATAVAQLPPRAWLYAYVDPQGIHGCQVGKPGGQYATPMWLTIGPGEGDNAHIQGYFARELVRVVVRRSAGD